MTRIAKPRPGTIAEGDFVRLGEAIAAAVFAPDRYLGRWYVVVGNRRRNCASYTTAEAWAKYLRRHGWRGISLQKVLP